MEQRPQAGGDFLFQHCYPRGDVLRFLRGLIRIEIPGHGDLIADLRLRFVDPRVRGVGEHFAGKVRVDILRQGDIFGVAEGGVGDGLALLFHDVSGFIPFRPFHDDLAVPEFLLSEDLAFAVHAALVAVHRAVPEFAVGPHDQAPAQVGDVVALGADGFAAGLVAAACVDELHPSGARCGLVLAEDPDIRGDAGVHELVGGKLHDGVEPVVFEDIAADLAGAASRVAGEQRRTVLNDRHFPVRRELGKAVQNKELLSVADLRESRREPPQFAASGLRLNRFLLPFPVDAEGGIRNAVAEGIAAEFVVGQGVAESHVVGISAPDHHVRLGNGEGGGVELLSEAGHLNLGVQLVNAFLHTGKHLARAHGHVVDRHVPGGGQVRVGEEQIGHEVDDVAAGEMRPGFLPEGFGKPAHKILEDIAAVHRADAVGAEVSLRGVEFLDDEIKGVALHHPLDDVIEVEFLEHILHVGGKSCKIVAEVGLDVLRVGQQLVEVEPADVIELVPGRLRQKAVDDLETLDFFIGVLHLLPRRREAVVKPLHHGHGKDDKAVFVGLERAAQHIRHVPDHGGLLGDVRADDVDFFVAHVCLGVCTDYCFP